MKQTNLANVCQAVFLEFYRDRTEPLHLDQRGSSSGHEADRPSARDRSRPAAQEGMPCLS